MLRVKHYLLFITFLLTSVSSCFAAMKSDQKVADSLEIPEELLNVVNNGTKKLRRDIIEVHFRLGRKMLDLMFKTHFAELRDYWHRRGESALSCEELKRVTDVLLQESVCNVPEIGGNQERLRWAMYNAIDHVFIVAAESGSACRSKKKKKKRKKKKRAGSSAQTSPSSATASLADMSLSDDDSGNDDTGMVVDDDPMAIDAEHDAAWRQKIWAEIIARKEELAQQRLRRK